jgi:tRNA (guanine-N7-)-methyltransferase
MELVLETYVVPLDLLAIFHRTAPLHVDLGCGDGAFLSALAARNPGKNFLGIERLSGRVEKARRKTAMFDNTRVLLAEASYAVHYLLPKGSVERFYLFFPDPWPKRRHHRRRIITPEFLNSSQVALKENGVFHIATDHLDYFQQIQRVVRNHLLFVNTGVDDADLPQTNFEKRFREQGRLIYRLALRKISPVT